MILAVFLGIFEFLENRAEARRESAQERLAALIRQANDLAIAQVKADASSGIAESNMRAAEAQATAKGFEADIGKANRQGAEANRIAEQERLARIKIEERLRPRSLTEEQHHRLVAVLKSYPAVPYESAVAPTPESLRFIAEIDNALIAAGWTFRKSAKTDFRFVSTVNGKETEQGVFTGIIVGTPPAIAAQFKPAADALVLWLYKEEFDAKGGLLANDDPSPGNIHVMIGSKE